MRPHPAHRRGTAAALRHRAATSAAPSATAPWRSSGATSRPTRRAAQRQPRHRDSTARCASCSATGATPATSSGSWPTPARSSSDSRSRRPTSTRSSSAPSRAIRARSGPMSSGRTHRGTVRRRFLRLRGASSRGATTCGRSRRRGFIFGTLLLPLGLVRCCSSAISSLVVGRACETGPADVRWSSSTSRPQLDRPASGPGADVTLIGPEEAEARCSGRLDQEYYLVPRDLPDPPEGAARRGALDGRSGIERQRHARRQDAGARGAAARRRCSSTCRAAAADRHPGASRQCVTGRRRPRRASRSRSAAVAASFLVPVRLHAAVRDEHLHHQRLPAPVGHRGEGEPGRRDRAQLGARRCR